jgi:hypothetical protein
MSKRLGHVMRELGGAGPKSIRIAGRVVQGYERRHEISETVQAEVM